ncbi:MAG: ABC transporter substrate-binding protein [Burkholderiales bacterium]|nr:ABC transporter substrate-binding protein [Burkholderiales bacterium]
MKRREFLSAAAVPALLAAVPIRARAKQKVTYAHLLDPGYDAVLWPIRNGKVKSDLIDLEDTGLLIPQLLQATATKQYDVIMTAVISVPAALARGLELRILSSALEMSPAGEGSGVWVRKGSPLRSGADLKGRTLGSYGLRSTGYMFVREALRREFGLNMTLEGGDVRQVEVQAPNLPAALATGQVNAATLIHSQSWRALQSGEFVNVCETGKILNAAYGQLTAAINVSYPDKLAAQPDAFREFNRMLKASAGYALSHRDEVFGAMARQANIDRKFFDWWFDRVNSTPEVFGDRHAKAVHTAWTIARAMGMVPSVPDVGALTWDKTLRA